MKPSPTNFPDNAYHIVFGCDDNYIKYASVAMMSIIYAIEPAFSTPESLSSTKKLGGQHRVQARCFSALLLAHSLGLRGLKNLAGILSH